MKKFIHLVLLFALVMSFSVNSVALAQEPTAEPTVDPAAQPTAEPTAEPTAPPTAEPTAPPTAEPTAPPTAEPTAPPTAEPTAPPTVEPTVEATATVVAPPVIDSFVATPSSITDTTTITTATLSWAVTGADTLALNDEDVTGLTEKLVTVTQTTTYTLKATNAGGSVESVVVVDVAAAPAIASGEIGTAAVVGSWTSHYIGLANLGDSATNVALSLYAGSSTSVQTISKDNVLKSSVILASEISNNGQFSGVMNSSQPLAVGVVHANYLYKMGDTYTAISSPAQQVVVPIAYRNHYTLRSTFYIQNAHSSPQNITVQAYKLGSSSPIATVTYNNVPANATQVVDFANDAAYDAFGSGNDIGVGSATISGASGNIAVTTDIQQDLGGSNTSQMVFNGMADAQQGTEVFVPIVYRGFSFWESGINVVNRHGSLSTKVTMTYVSNNGTFIFEQDASAGQLINFYTPNLVSTTGATIPAGSYGFATFRTDNAAVEIVAAALNSRFGYGSSYVQSGTDTSTATSRAVIPLAFGKFTDGANQWFTGINVYNLDAGNTVTAQWIKSDAPGTIYSQASPSLSASALYNFFDPDNVSAAGVTTGAVYISTNNGGRILIGGSHAYGNDLSGFMPGVNY